MADKEKPKDAAPPAREGEAAAGAAKKKLPIKTVGVVGAIMIIEAVVVFVVFGMGGPKDAAADVGQHSIEHDDSEMTQEIEVLADKFQNMQTGKVWIWDVSIFAQVKNKHADAVTAALESRQAEIAEGVNQLISKAHHNHLKEPERQTLIRQITAYLQKVTEPKHGGEPLIERVLIPKCNGFPADF